MPRVGRTRAVCLPALVISSSEYVIRDLADVRFVFEAFN